MRGKHNLHGDHFHHYIHPSIRQRDPHEYFTCNHLSLTHISPSRFLVCTLISPPSTAYLVNTSDAPFRLNAVWRRDESPPFLAMALPPTVHYYAGPYEPSVIALWWVQRRHCTVSGRARFAVPFEPGLQLVGVAGGVRSAVKPVLWRP